MDDIHFGRETFFAFGNGIERLVRRSTTGTIHGIEVEATSTTRVKHVDMDLAFNTAIGITASESRIVNGTAKEVKGDIAFFPIFGPGIVQNVSGFPLGIFGKFACDTTLRTSKEIIKGAAKHIDSDIAINVGQIGTTIEILVRTGTTFDESSHIAINFCIVTTAEAVTDSQGASATIFNVQIDFFDLA